MNRIDKKFKELRNRGKKAFIPFLTAGYPNLAVTEKLVLELEKNGADIIELGVPFSDPIADGPVIQAASYEALKKGVTLKKILSLVGELRKKTQIPLVAMSYFNPILHYGLSRFVRDAVHCGLDAIIVPDLPLEEEPEFRSLANKSGLEVILFVSPTTPLARVRLIVKKAKGFIYFVSLTGVTGARQELPRDLRMQLAGVKKIARPVPVCAGFGVSTKEQVHYVCSLCDGVIVGSAIITKITENLFVPGLVSRVGRFVKALSSHV